MAYKIRDMQFKERYFAEGKVFKTKREICEQLIDYHSADCDMGEEIDLLNRNEVSECFKALMQFGWKAERI